MKRSFARPVLPIACTRVAVSACLAAAALGHLEPAAALRPFDLTDAAVADRGEIELELGPFGRLRERGSQWSIVPAVVVNAGLADERELVLEGKLQRATAGRDADTPRTSLVDTALSLKQVLRRGALQNGSGVSVANECGLLLPTWHSEPGVGGACSLIASAQWPVTTLHLNGALSFNRAHHWTRLLGVIVEGPGEWPVRPAAEVWTEREARGSSARSGLLALIWRESEHLSFDAGARRETRDGITIRELRGGLTWSFGSAR
jgi:hypothetical protein